MIYKLTLRPLDYYFFGTNKKYQRKLDEKKEHFRTNYSIDSYKWPQQTSILGMLRKQVLIWNNEFNLNGKYENESKIQSLIGKEGFKLEKVNEELDYGVIKKISPVFLEKEGVIYTEGPFDIQLGEPIKINEELSKSILRLSLNGKIKDNYLIENYDPKSSFENSYVSLSKSSRNLKNEDDFFEFSSMLQVKIENDKESEIFRKQRYKLKEDVKFVFYAEIEESLIIADLKKDIVFIGGEKSAFELEVFKEGEKSQEFDDLEIISVKFDKYIKFKEKQYSKIYALSDIYLSSENYDEIYNFILGGYIQYINFNCFTNKINDIKINENKKRLIEGRNKIIKRGSYFIIKTEDEEKFKALIEKNKIFKQIGYNYIVG